MRTPRPYYFKFGVVEFYVKNKEIYYKIKKWTEDGLYQYLHKTGKYDGNMEKLNESITGNNEISSHSI